jgi:hypothetical protein
MPDQPVEGIDYIPSAFSGTIPRNYPHLWELVIEELDPNVPGGLHRARGGYCLPGDAQAAYNEFWTQTSGDHRRIIVFVQIWPPAQTNRQFLSPIILLNKRKAYQEGRLR